MRKLALVPNLITLCNAACGFTAMVKVSAACFQAGGDAAVPIDWATPAWFIFLGMVFDAFDGKVARMVNVASDFGGQLDSLCDAVSFGVAPAIIVALMNATFFHTEGWGKLAWVFSLMFALCVILRLARFNVENEPDEGSHETFKGLPSPAGAGCLMSVVLLQSFLLDPDKSQVLRELIGGAPVDTFAHGLTRALPVLAVLTGVLMVSNLHYSHVVTRYFKGRKPISYLALFMFAILLVVTMPEVAIAGLFIGYALTGPLGYVRALLSTDTPDAAPKAAAAADSPGAAPVTGSADEPPAREEPTA